MNVRNFNIGKGYAESTCGNLVLTCYWEKGLWLSNSPDLNPIENLSATMQSGLDKRKQPQIIRALESGINSHPRFWRIIAGNNNSVIG